MAKEDMTVTFVTLFCLTWIAGVLAGSTIQWVVSRGLFAKSWRDPNNQYNIIVFIAGASAGTLAPFNFFLYYLAPDNNFAYSIFLLCNWMIMTHSSIMVVSKKLSITYRNPNQVWHRLLLINVAMLPVSLLVCVTWGGNANTDLDAFETISRIVEPIQMSLWGLIEFTLSGLFIVKMWKFKWTKVERHGIFVLVLVGICDIMSVVTNIILGDYESTVVKAFVYCLRIRLEIGVLCSMAEFLKKKRRKASSEIFNSKSFGLSQALKEKSGDNRYSRSMIPFDLCKQWGIQSTINNKASSHNKSDDHDTNTTAAATMATTGSASVTFALPPPPPPPPPNKNNILPPHYDGGVEEEEEEEDSTKFFAVQEFASKTKIAQEQQQEQQSSSIIATATTTPDTSSRTIIPLAEEENEEDKEEDDEEDKSSEQV